MNVSVTHVWSSFTTLRPDKFIIISGSSIYQLLFRFIAILMSQVVSSWLVRVLGTRIQAATCELPIRKMYAAILISLIPLATFLTLLVRKRRLLGWFSITNWKGYVLKPSWPILIHCRRISLVGKRKISVSIADTRPGNRTRNLPNTKDYITFRDELPLVLRSWSLREPSALKIDSSIIRVQIVVVDFVYQNRKQSSFP